jgi:glutathione S-transferase
MMTKLARLPLRNYQNIQAWYERVRELPAWKETEPPQLAMLEARKAAVQSTSSQQAGK